MALIELTNIDKTYLDDGPMTAALSGATFKIEKGELVSIMGPSGSGKSTLLHILGFLDRPTAGLYRFAGHTMDELDDIELARVRNEEMGFVFQAFNLLPRTTVLENVILPLGYSTVPESKWRGMAEAALSEVGLSHRLEHAPPEPSRGGQKRVAIARALVNNPSVLFADEPTGNLASKSGIHVMDIFEDLNKHGKTIIIITHDEKVARRAKRVITLTDGKILSDAKL